MKKVLLLAILLFSASAQAAGNFIGGNFGAAFGYISSVDSLTTGFINSGASSASAEQKTGGLNFGFQAGRWFNENLGWEFGYNSLGEISGSWNATGVSAGFLTGNYKYSASAMHFALLGGTPVDSGKLYGKAGLFSAKTKSSYVAAGGSASSSEKASQGLLLAAGLVTPINENLSSRFEVSMLNGVAFKDVWDGADVSKTMFQITLGINYQY